jgi:hypothetical protein
MIYGLVGGLGHGKGIFSCEIMEQAAATGRRIVTNMELTEHCPFYRKSVLIGTKEWPLMSPSLSIWDYAPELLRGAFILIDEADIDFDCADHKSFEKGAKAWLKHTRKLGQDVVFVLQDINNLNVRIRRLINIVWACEWTWRSEPGWQMLGRLPFMTRERAKQLTRFRRYQFNSWTCNPKSMVGCVTERYGYIAAKYFKNPWYRTDQIIGSHEGANAVARKIAELRSGSNGSRELVPSQ